MRYSAEDLGYTGSHWPGRCLAECATDADCPIAGAFQCEGGLCRLDDGY